MRLDSTGRTLLRAARFMEQSGPLHPVVAIWLQRGSQRDFCRASTRFIRACGRRTFRRCSREERVDALVAAAFWEEQ